MFNLEWIATVGIAYLLLLFLIAYIGDSDTQWLPFRIKSNVIYALSLAVYCSSWTFYGAVGTAAVRGLDYLAIYLGPILVFLFGYSLMRRLISICKQNNITTISDFISSRFAKSRRIGVLVTFIAVVGSLPYIALQLQAVSQSYLVLQAQSETFSAVGADAIAFYTGLMLALFAILFGTRHLDATEHHRGMVLAIAFESIVKLAAIIAVGYYAFYLLLDSSSHNSLQKIVDSGARATALEGSSSTWVSFLTRTILSMGAIILLPRQFQVTVVECEDHQQFKTAAWLMPLYLLLTSLIVIPISLAGSILLPEGQEDLYVLSLPLLGNNQTLGMIAFIGGLSAATGMVIVAVISLSTMICNDWVMPRLILLKSIDVVGSGRLDQVILLVRRLAILVLIAGAYSYYLLMNHNANLANIGLVSFAAVFLFMPALLAALFWQRAHSKGVFWGLVGGFLVWIYTLLLPSILSAEVIETTIGSNAWLHPQHLFSLEFGDSLAHGVFWSLLVNASILIFFTLREEQGTLESLQANRFFNINFLLTAASGKHEEATVVVHPGALRILAERVIGVKNTDKVFSEYELRTGKKIGDQGQIDNQLLLLVQTAIAGVIGTASAQRVVADTVAGNDQYLKEISTLVDASSSLLKFNRKLLETTLQNITHGIAVVDKDLNLVVWNDRYLELFEYPDDLIYIGKPISEVLQYNADRGDFGDRNTRGEIQKRLRFLQQREPYQSTRTRANGVTIKSTGEPMPGGGFVTTYEDITESVKSSELLRKANEELESRVRQRTRELEVLTQELEQNTRSKTHFLAAASHDLLQPINAARLFTQSVIERKNDPEQVARLAGNVDESLHTANQLLRALLDISKLDAGGIKPKFVDFDLSKLIVSLLRELNQTAKEAGVKIEYHEQEMWLKTDPQLLLSVLQNLIGNAIRYTPEGGRVLIQSRLTADQAVISVIDTGPGIEPEEIQRIFTEFYQIKGSTGAGATGLGLGLSIVKRICKLLGLEIAVDSALGNGSNFSINIPLGTKPDSLAEAAPENRSLVASNRLLGLRVLCVDNDEVVLHAMQTLLEGWGCEVVSVTEYSKAKTLLDEGEFELVLADYRLDSLETGLDLLRTLHRENQNLPSSAIAQTPSRGVLITAEQNDELKESVTQIGCEYLAKPVDPAALRSIILYLTTLG